MLVLLVLPVLLVLLLRATTDQRLGVRRQRTAFYLGQTYQALEQVEEALRWCVEDAANCD